MALNSKGSNSGRVGYFVLVDFAYTVLQTVQMPGVCNTLYGNVHCSESLESFNKRISVDQQTQEIDPMLVRCWSTVYDAGPTLNKHWVNLLCLLCCVVKAVHDCTENHVKLCLLSHSLILYT